MRDYLLLEEFAAQWAVDGGDSMEETRAEILMLFWEGRFERMGRGSGPGTVLTVREELRGNLPDQEFDGMPFGRTEFLTQIFFGPCRLPEWRQWSPVVADRSANHDPAGYRFKQRYLDSRSPAMLQDGFYALRDCPFEKYVYPADEYLRSLGFPLEMLGRFFAERRRNRPPFLVRAQARFSGMRFTGGKGGRGRKRHEVDPARLEDWMSTLIQRQLSIGETMSADEAYRQAQVEFHRDVPRWMVREVHARMAPAEWHQKGRRRAH